MEFQQADYQNLFFNQKTIYLYQDIHQLNQPILE